MEYQINPANDFMLGKTSGWRLFMTHSKATTYLISQKTIAVIQGDIHTAALLLAFAHGVIRIEFHGTDFVKLCLQGNRQLTYTTSEIDPEVAELIRYKMTGRCFITLDTRFQSGAEPLKFSPHPSGNIWEVFPRKDFGR